VAEAEKGMPSPTKRLQHKHSDRCEKSLDAVLRKRLSDARRETQNLASREGISSRSVFQRRKSNPGRKKGNALYEAAFDRTARRKIGRKAKRTTHNSA